jgi:hypothetical protein
VGNIAITQSSVNPAVLKPRDISFHGLLYNGSLETEIECDRVNSFPASFSGRTTFKFRARAVELEAFRGLPQSVQEITEAVPQIRPWPLPLLC